MVSILKIRETLSKTNEIKCKGFDPNKWTTYRRAGSSPDSLIQEDLDNE